MRTWGFKKLFKKRKGVTLLELVIAIGILLVAVVPIYGLYQLSVKTNATAHKITLATFSAQQKIEEFVGLTESEITGALGAEKTKTPFENYNGFNGQAWWEKDENGDDPGDSEALIKVSVEVLDSADGSTLIMQTNIINVIEGGIS